MRTITLTVEVKSLSRSKVVKEDVQSLRLLAVILDNDARAVDDFAGVSFTVNLAETDPLAELLAVSNLDEVDLVLVA